MSIEVCSRRVYTRLAIIIDPPKQTPREALLRVDEFIQRGGGGVLIGGSGAVESVLFEDTVAEIIAVTTKASTPVWILPGHIDQIPIDGRGITGVLNYEYIMGNGGNDFNTVYPREARELVAQTLQARKIPNIPTLYVLCGDPNASVSKVSGILPLDLTSPSDRNRCLKNVNIWLGKVGCVYFESGSHPPLRQIIDRLRATSSLFFSGGIRNPAYAKLFAGIADYVVVSGRYSEGNGVKDVSEFVSALKT